MPPPTQVMPMEHHLNYYNQFYNGFNQFFPMSSVKKDSKKSKKSSRISNQKVPHILPSIIKVGGDSASNLGSAVKSSTTFSPIRSLRRSKCKKTKKSDSKTSSSIKIKIRPGMIGGHSIVSSEKQTPNKKSSLSSSSGESGSESSSSRTSSSMVPITAQKLNYENGLFMMQYPPGFYVHPLL